MIEVFPSRASAKRVALLASAPHWPLRTSLACLCCMWLPASPKRLHKPTPEAELLGLKCRPASMYFIRYFSMNRLLLDSAFPHLFCDLFHDIRKQSRPAAPSLANGPRPATAIIRLGQRSSCCCPNRRDPESTRLWNGRMSRTSSFSCCSSEALLYHGEPAVSR